MTVADEHVYKFQVDIFENGWVMTQNMSKIGTFNLISGLNRDLSNFIFTDFDASKSIIVSFSRSLRNSDWKTCTYHSFKCRFFVWSFLPGDLS